MVTQKINTHNKMLDEILVIVNKSDDVVQTLKDALGVPYLKYYMELAVNELWPTFDLDKINPKQYGYHRSLTGALLLNKQTVNIMSNVIMAPALPDNIKIKQYNALREMLFVDESVALNAIMNKNIESIYPNITFLAINAALNNA